MATLTGRTVGGFQIMEELGRGAMGVVFKAKQISMDRNVAIKFLPNRLAKDEKVVARFLREARAAGQLTHPNIVGVHDVGMAEGLHYIAMEFVDGNSVHRKIRENGPYSEKDTLQIAVQIADALKFAHGRGILHRDIKPDNFLIDSAGRVRLADLGLARFMNDDGGRNPELTQDGTAMGTPHYMSPEQCKGIVVDARSDLYSLGAAMFVMATGKMPYEANSAAAVMVKVITEAPRSLKQVAPQLSPSFVAVVDKMMHKDPAKRFQSAEEVLAALDQCKTGSYKPVVEKFSTVTRPANSLKAKILPLAAGAFGAVALIIGLLVTEHNKRERRREEEERQRLANANTDDNKKSKTDDTRKDDTGKNPVNTTQPANTNTAEKPPEPSNTTEPDKEEPHEVRGPRGKKFLEFATEGAKLLARQNPRQAWDRLQHLRRKIHPEFQQEAAALLDIAEAEIKSIVSAEWQKTVAVGLALANQGKLDQAIMLGHAFAEKYPFATEAKDVLAKLDKQLVEQNAKAQKLLDAGDYDAAKKELALVKDLGTYAGALPLKETLAKVDAKIAERTALEEAEFRKLLEVQKEAWALTREANAQKERKYNFAGAADLYRDTGAKFKLAATRDQAAAFQMLYTQSDEVFKRIREAINNSIDKFEVSLGPMTAKLLAWKDENYVTFKHETLGEQKFAVKRITPGDFLRIMEVFKVANSETAVDLFDLGSFAYATGQDDLARLKLNAAADKNAQYKAPANAVAKALEPVIKATRDKQAEDLFKQAQAMAKQAKPNERDALNKLLERLVYEFADTPAIAQNITEIDRLRRGTAEVKVEDDAERKKKEDELRKAQAEALKAATKAALTKALTDLGWKDVEGGWTQVENSRTAFNVTNGQVSSPLKDVRISVRFKLEKGARLNVMARYEDDIDDKLDQLVTKGASANRLGKGYGASITPSRAEVYGNVSLKEVVRRDNDKPILNKRVPVHMFGESADIKEGQWHTVEILANGNRFDMLVNGKSLYRSSFEMRSTGKVILEITGTATVETPRVIPQIPTP